MHLCIFSVFTSLLAECKLLFLLKFKRHWTEIDTAHVEMMLTGSLHRTLCFLSAVWMCVWRCHCDYDLSGNTASWICLNGDIPAMTNTWHEWKSFHRFIIKPNTENSANSFSEASPLHTNRQTEMSQRVYSLIWKKSLSVTFIYRLTSLL